MPDLAKEDRVGRDPFDPLRNRWVLTRPFR